MLKSCKINIIPFQTPIGEWQLKFPVPILPHSLAKRQIEIREASTGLIQGFYAGRNLELKIVERTEDRPPRQQISQPVIGLSTTIQNQSGEKSRLNL